jgi:hypothetical protein
MAPKSRFRFAFLALLLAPLGLALAQQAQQPAPLQPPPSAQNPFQQRSGNNAAAKFEPADAGKPLQVKITGPFTHDNLSIFLFHGPDQIKLGKYLMLADAMEKKLFVIHETQNVNQLQMENLSPDSEVIILSGDILKGGQQDRFAQFDPVVPPKSGKIPLPAYCVERTASRWMAKLDAKTGQFETSPGQVVSQSQRLAGRFYMDQSAVWKEVGTSQARLGANAKVSVKATASDSSLALSLQVKEVVEAGDKYIKKLQPAVENGKDVVGYAYAINGKVYAADVYGSNELFGKVWPRLIRANAVEAFADLEKGKKFEAATVKMVEEFLKAADSATAKGRALDGGKRLREVLSNDEKARVLRFETQDERQKDSFLRRNYLKY